MKQSLFALTTRGLENVSAREITMQPNTRITTTAYRRVAFVSDGDLAPYLTLRTVDDVYLDLALWNEISRPRSTLDIIRKYSADLDLDTAANVLHPLRSITETPVFSVTASFVGKRNYSSDEIKLAVADGMYRTSSWLYSGDDAVSDYNIRVFLEHEIAYVGVRLSKTPLHDRAYKSNHIAGSLKPPVAAGMLILADVQPGMRLVDPCCGGGTILIEGEQMGALAQGGDHDQAAVTAAQANIGSAGVDVLVEKWDAQQLPIDESSIDRVVSNLPWGRQIEVDDQLTTFYERTLAEITRVLKPGGRATLLTSLPHLLETPDLQRLEEIEISLFGQTPTIVLFAKE